MFKRAVLFSVMMSASALSHGALRVDGMVVQPYPHELIGATVESRIQVVRQSDPSAPLASATTMYVVAQGEVADAAWGKSTDADRTLPVKVPTGIIERLAADGTTSREVVLTESSTQEGLTFSTRFAATSERFVGEVRGQINYAISTETLEFHGKDYALPVVRQIHFEQPIVLGLNQFVIDGMIVEIDTAANMETLGGKGK